MSSLLKVQTCWSYLLSTWHLTWVNARVYYVYYVHFSHLFPKHNICLIVNMICMFAWRRDPEMSVTRETLPHPQGIHVLDSLTMTLTMTTARIISMTITMTTTTHRVQNCDVKLWRGFASLSLGAWHAIICRFSGNLCPCRRRSVQGNPCPINQQCQVPSVPLSNFQLCDLITLLLAY